MKFLTVHSLTKYECGPYKKQYFGLKATCSTPAMKDGICDDFMIHTHTCNTFVYKHNRMFKRLASIQSFEKCKIKYTKDISGNIFCMIVCVVNQIYE